MRKASCINQPRVYWLGSFSLVLHSTVFEPAAMCRKNSVCILKMLVFWFRKPQVCWVLWWHVISCHSRTCLPCHWRAALCHIFLKVQSQCTIWWSSKPFNMARVKSESPITLYLQYFSTSFAQWHSDAKRLWPLQVVWIMPPTPLQIHACFLKISTASSRAVLFTLISCLQNL